MKNKTVYRVSCVTDHGTIEGSDFNTLEECYDYLLKQGYKRYMIKDKNTREIIETDRRIK